jgi:CRISPR-associated endonuclease/helicase Cas3
MVLEMRRSYSSELAAIEAHPGEPLVEHLWSVAERAEATASALPGGGPVAREALRRAAWILGASHDLAKATPYFQAHLRGEKVDPKLRSHAFTSAVIGYLWARDGLPDPESDSHLRDFLPLAVFLAIRRHHGFLRKAYEEASLDVDERDLVDRQWAALRRPPFDELLSLIGAPWTATELGARFEQFWLKNETRTWRKLLTRLERESTPRFYLTENLLFSLLIDADRFQTALGGTSTAPDRGSVTSDLVDAYRRAKGWGKATDGVASLRERLHAEVTATVGALDLDDHFYSLTAPTGLGKTVTIASWLLKLRERIARERGYQPRIVYCLPFLSIIDQNAAVLRESLAQPGSDVLVVHHHLGDSRYVASDNEFDSDASRLLIEGWQSEIVVTTFVQIFATLVNNRSRPLMRLSRLAGAIVVLDEVQTLPARYWSLFETLARELAAQFDTTFVLVTATQPALFPAERPRELVPHPAEYFTRMGRITLVNESAEPLDLAGLAERVTAVARSQPRRSVGLVVNTTRSAYELRAMLASDLGESHEIIFLSSLVAPVDRLAQIARAKDLVESARRPNAGGRPLLLVSTQVIEAGVDLDLDELFRDFAPLDSVVQAAGRCNRNGALPSSGLVHLVRLVDENGRGFAEWVYDRVLLDASREVLAGHSRIPEYDLAPLVERYFRLLRDRVSTSASGDVLQAVHALNYYAEGARNGRDVAIADFTLIEDDQPSADVFLELDDWASAAWREFRSARGIADRRDRLRRYGEIRPRLAPYVISVPKRLLTANLPFLDGESYYVPRDQIADYYDRSTGWNLDPKTHQIW